MQRQHSELVCKEKHQPEAAYARAPDLWKGSEYRAIEEAVSRYVERRRPYRICRKRGQGVIVRLPSRAGSAELRREFDELVRRWEMDTSALSSLTKIYAHPAYQRIMAMGAQGIPFVLNELRKNKGHWFYALKFMAGQDVSEGMTDFEDAKAAWLQWGYTNNYV